MNDSLFVNSAGTRRFDESLRSSATAPHRRNLLTVFQAAPLVNVDPYGCAAPIDPLDFETERLMLEESLCGSHIKIDVDYDIATPDRINAFMAKQEGSVLHFSCHGDPNYLAIEDGWGALQDLTVQDLKGFVEAGGQSLQFVFVSACHSRKTGEAFIKAGVPHVLCCQKESHRIRSVAAADFSRAFYRALAFGNSLEKSFQLARQQVRTSSQMHPFHREEEANKFILLPANGNHDVPLFWEDENPRAGSPCRQSPSLCTTLYPTMRLPLRPKFFQGREVEMFRVLEAIRHDARLIRITGAEGIGKTGVVQAVCQYMKDRFSILNYQTFWIPTCGDLDDDTSKLLMKVFELMVSFDGHKELFFGGHKDEDEAVKCIKRIIKNLYSLKVLIVFDATSLNKIGHAMQHFASFLEQVIQNTLYVKFIVIQNAGELATTISTIACIEKEIYIKPLSFTSSVSLFVQFCNHVSDKQYFKDQLLRKASWDKPTSARSRKIYVTLGEGNPKRILKVAKTMSQDEFIALYNLGIQEENAQEFKSRAALDMRLAELHNEKGKALKAEDFLYAKECKDIIDEINFVRESMPDLESLISLAASTASDLALATQAEDYNTANRLKEQRVSLKAKIKIERQALTDFGISTDEGKQEEHGSRAEVESEIHKLNVALVKAIADEDVYSAKTTHGRICWLQSKRDHLPSIEMLDSAISDLCGEFKAAMEDKQWDKAEEVQARLRITRERWQAECNAEKLLNSSLGDGNNKSNSTFSSEGFAPASDRVEPKSSVPYFAPALHSVLPNSVTPGAFSVRGPAFLESESIDSFDESTEEMLPVAEDVTGRRAPSTVSDSCDPLHADDIDNNKVATPSMPEELLVPSLSLLRNTGVRRLDQMQPQSQQSHPSILVPQHVPLENEEFLVPTYPLLQSIGVRGLDEVQTHNQQSHPSILVPHQVPVENSPNFPTYGHTDMDSQFLTNNIVPEQTYVVKGRMLRQIEEKIRHEIISNTCSASDVIAVPKEEHLRWISGRKGMENIKNMLRRRKRGKRN